MGKKTSLESVKRQFLIQPIRREICNCGSITLLISVNRYLFPSVTLYKAIPVYFKSSVEWLFSIKCSTIRDSEHPSYRFSGRQIRVFWLFYQQYTSFTEEGLSVIDLQHLKKCISPFVWFFWCVCVSIMLLQITEPPQRHLCWQVTYEGRG